MKSSGNPIVLLKDKEPFASGGNRLCFRHPENTIRCLKIIRPDRTPEMRRKEKGFPAILRPLSTYNENLVETSVLRYLHDNYPMQITQHLQRSYGLVKTDLGVAHETDLICDTDGLISQTLEQYIWNNGLNPTVEQAIQSFKGNWIMDSPRTRDLIPHNFVVQLTGEKAKLVLIDGYGRKPNLRAKFSNLFGRARFNRRIQNFEDRIQLVMERKAANSGPMHRIDNLKRDEFNR